MNEDKKKAGPQAGLKVWKVRSGWGTLCTFPMKHGNILGGDWRAMSAVYHANNPHTENWFHAA